MPVHRHNRQTAKLDSCDVHIDVRGHGVRVVGGVGLGLFPSLSHPVRRTETGGPYGYLQTTEVAHYWQTDGDDLIIRAGLVPRVVEHLQGQGLQVHVRDEVAWLPFRRANRDLLTHPDLTVEDREFLMHLVNNPRGQIVPKTRRQGLRSMALLAALLPQSNIVIVTTSYREARKLKRALRRLLDGPVRDYPIVSGAAPAQVYVCVANNFPFCNSDLWDVVIFDGARPALGRQAHERALRLRDAFLYCVRWPREELGPHEDMRLESIFGRVVHDGSGGVRSAPVQVGMAQLPDLREVRLRPTHFRASANFAALERKRTNIWHNGRRNRVVANISRALVSGDMPDLWNYGLLLHQDDDFLSDQFPHRQVAILVESAEHGRRLSELLSDWELVTASPDDRDVISVPSSFSRTIVTELFAHEAGFSCDVLVRATGGNAPLLVPDSGRLRLVIDLADDANPFMEQQTRARIRDYQRQSWTVQAGNKWLSEYRPPGSYIVTCQSASEMEESVRKSTINRPLTTNLTA